MTRTNHNNDELARGPAEPDEADHPGSLTTRRALIAGAAAGLAGLVADSVISAQPANAANGDTVLLGTSNSASAPTEITISSGDCLQGLTWDASGNGVFAMGNTGASTAKATPTASSAPMHRQVPSQ
ncbi:MAG: hypothetical protein ABSD85_17580 [Acidimicrobiales bacterium]|jgi:hypothetical protein